MKRAMVVAAAALAALVLLELVLRATGYSAPQLYQLDPQLGWSLRAHRHGWRTSDGARGYAIINPAGFRDREHPLDKPDPVYRIAVLGDEYSEAAPVALRDTWWWQLEPQLQRCDFQPGKLIEVLNFGVAGYSTAQELMLLQTRVMRYAPDLVLLQFAPDDVIDNSYALAPNKLRPFYLLDAHGLPRIDESFTTAPDFERGMQTRYRLAAEIADHTRAFQLVRELARQTLIAPAHADEVPLGAPSDSLHEQAWRITEALIAKMNDYVRRNGAALDLVAVPAAAEEGHGVAYADQRLAALGKRLDLPVIALAPYMHRAHYRASGAWTVEGHRAAAAALAQRLCPATAPPG
jgi:hypothetical protein